MNFSGIARIGAVLTLIATGAVAQDSSYGRAQVLQPHDDGTDTGSFAGEAITNAPLALARSCTRHFYNKSDLMWDVQGSPGSGVCDARSPCYVFPHQTIEIHYPVIDRSMSITVRGDHGRQYNRTFDLKLGNLVQTGNCAYISHDGNTGDIAVNNPANGDIVALNTGKKPLHTKVFPKPSKTIKSKGHLCGGAVSC